MIFLASNHSARAVSDVGSKHLAMTVSFSEFTHSISTTVISVILINPVGCVSFHLQNFPGYTMTSFLVGGLLAVVVCRRLHI